jgi:hypothetical protein
MASIDPILEETLKCLWAHCHPQRGDRHPIDVFNRLLAKNVRPAGFTKNTHLNITPDQISSRRERWSTADLSQLDRAHTSVAGEDFDCPVVLVEYRGKVRVIDGNHRINRWVADQDKALHDVNIHRIDTPGEFVELPDARQDA